MAAQPGISTSSAPPNAVVQVQPGMNIQPVVLVDQNGNFITPVPQSQTQPTIAGVAQTSTIYTFNPAGTTDTLAQFSDMFVAASFGAPPILETYQLSGYNLLPSPGHVAGDASVYTAIHPDAGDTSIAGAHGIEWLVGMAGPSAAWSINPILVLAVADSSQSLGITFTCGTGSDTGRVSGFNFNDSTNATWFTLGPKTSLPNGAGPGVVSFKGFAVFPPSGTGTAAEFFAASPDQGVNLTFNAATSMAVQMFFQQNTATKWSFQLTTGGYFALNDASSGNYPMFIQPVASDVPLFRTQSTFRVETGSLIVGNAAILTTATRGFLYLPSCAGAPTGVPVTQTGTVPSVYDTTDARLYIYEGGAWHYIAMTA